MVLIKQLSVKNIRSHEILTVDFSDNTTVITGDNGTGKTSLLEAIYVALRGSSFKGSDNELLRQNSDWWRIDITTLDHNIAVKYNPSKLSKKKQYEIDEKIFYRLPATHKKPVILFEPEDLRLINGSPARRRQFIDKFITQIDKTYSVTLSRYEKAMKQRNSLFIQENLNYDQLFAWNVMLSDYGSRIIKLRHYYTSLLNQTINKLYAQISDDNNQIEIEYSHNPDDFTENTYLAQLNNSQERDHLLKSTSVGPHRHDVIFNFNKKPASKVVSRGEARSMILALKLSEFEIVKNQFNENPIVLMDDVFSELDNKRQRSLARIAKDSQIIITSAHIPEDLNATVVTLRQYIQ